MRWKASIYSKYPRAGCYFVGEIRIYQKCVRRFGERLCDLLYVEATKHLFFLWLVIYLQLLYPLVSLFRSHPANDTVEPGSYEISAHKIMRTVGFRLACNCSELRGLARFSR